MRKSFLMTAIAVTLIAAPALAQTPPAGGGMMGGGMAGRGAGMTQDQRVMQFINQKTMTPEQIQAERASMRDLSEADRAKMVAGLDAQWAKLTPAQKTSATAEWQAVAAARGAGRGQ